MCVGGWESEQGGIGVISPDVVTTWGRGVPLPSQAGDGLGAGFTGHIHWTANVICV